MSEIKKLILSACIGFFAGATSVVWAQSIKKECEKKEGDTATIVWRQNHFPLTKDNLLNELKAQGMKFPEIVLAQAILETGHFKSYACTHKNNLFGLRRKDKTYMKFQHWTESVAAYKNYIQNWKKPPSDYYVYLENLGYAEDKLYTSKLRQIVKTLK